MLKLHTFAHLLYQEQSHNKGMRNKHSGLNGPVSLMEIFWKSMIDSKAN